ncbi:MULTISPECIES: hypothetical protein [unclassified Acidovorax]|uniref:hypothetical protein n=1 Tax=unclassified Acidovorax TaxID=2684926 RepID=UPI001E544773|nr:MULTISPECIES: hypothetical protein [unclassified Acidovorax]
MIAWSDPCENFRAAIASAGLPPPEDIEADGTIHRFSTSGKRTDDSGWYLLHLYGIRFGAFGCWREGLHSIWSGKADNEMTTAERDADHTERQRQAAEAAALILTEATTATERE